MEAGTKDCSFFMVADGLGVLGVDVEVSLVYSSGLVESSGMLVNSTLSLTLMGSRDVGSVGVRWRDILRVIF